MESVPIALGLAYTWIIHQTQHKGPHSPDAIWQCDANFQFSMTFNFNIFQCFSKYKVEQLKSVKSTIDILTILDAEIFTL
jgi:hypothetical protein